MFSSRDRTRSTLLRGPAALTKPFVFEAAVHWAEEGHRVVYITPAPLDSLPATYHDRNAFSLDAFRLMRFMYLENYEMLVQQLADLHNFQTLPSVLLIDDLDAYAADPTGRQNPRVHVAGLLALCLDTANACSRILDRPIHLCVASFATEIPPCLYFRDEWRVLSLEGDDAAGSCLRITRPLGDGPDESRAEAHAAFDYEKFNDGTLVLRRIVSRAPRIHD